MTTFVVVGAGWRAEMFWRLAAELPDVDCVGAVVRTPRELPVPALRTIDEVRADFVVTAVPWDVNAQVVRDAVQRGLPVLAETPPAPDLPAMRVGWGFHGINPMKVPTQQHTNACWFQP
ncbi:gfo/Idh/MocA family oxidoreductase, partial [Actinoplanes sp. NPDC051633]